MSFGLYSTLQQHGFQFVLSSTFTYASPKINHYTFHLLAIYAHTTYRKTILHKSRPENPTLFDSSRTLQQPPAYTSHLNRLVRRKRQAVRTRHKDLPPRPRNNHNTGPLSRIDKIRVKGPSLEQPWPWTSGRCSVPTYSNVVTKLSK